MMRGEPIRILLTGPPGCGKTTAVRKIVDALGHAKIAGFYTEEIRAAGTRKGFRWHRLDGPTGILAHVDIQGPQRVSKYGVDIRGLEEHVVPILDPHTAEAEFFAIDEIGKMECFSERFVEAVRNLLQSDKSVLATVARRGSGFIREVKDYPGVRLLQLTRANRDRVAQEIIGLLRRTQRP